MEKWNEQEFEIFKTKLEKLSIKELRILARKTGISFTNDPEMLNLNKNDILLVLDETDPEELKQEYRKILNSKI